jgi:hypothetical protein
MKIKLLVLLLLMLKCNTDKGKITVVKNKDCLIDNADLFEEISEKILANKYGQSNIRSQKPYKIGFRRDSIWTIEGTLRPGYDGGVFYLEMSCITGAVLKLQHTK